MSQATGVRSPARNVGAPAMVPGPGRAVVRRGREPSVDPHRWPDVATVPPGRFRAAVARWVLALAAARLPIRVVSTGGQAFGAGDEDAPRLLLRRPGDFYRRVGAHGLIGFGESYMAGDWESDDLTGLLTVMCSLIDRLVPRRLQWLRQLYVARPPAACQADEAGARVNAQQHYDLSNELFSLFLDETMTYSAALFGSTDVVRTGPDHLVSAQRRKIDRLLDLTGVGPGSRVLEIGTGWGELAIRAAARGATVRSVTLSAQQRELAQRRIAAAGLAGQISVELLDYRQVRGQYDVILSVEMVEAVAERYWPQYFGALDRLLAPGGRVGLQAITMPHDRMLATRRTQTWILKYIFPGGLIPSVRSIEDNLREHTALRVDQRLEFGGHYARTLRIWRERFCAAAAQVTALGFDDVFRRMWLLYLCYSEAGFLAGYLQVSQFLLQRGDPGATAPPPEHR
jgi:cyclopropane-fatty-acyl-phospholipid synthase